MMMMMIIMMMMMRMPRPFLSQGPYTSYYHLPSAQFALLFHKVDPKLKFRKTTSLLICFIIIFMYLFICYLYLFTTLINCLSILIGISDVRGSESMRSELSHAFLSQHQGHPFPGLRGYFNIVKTPRNFYYCNFYCNNKEIPCSFKTEQ